MKFAVGFVLYYPKSEEIDRINKWNKSCKFDKCLVYDNSIESHENQMDSGIVYFHNGKNDGLPIAYNKFIDYCANNNIHYLCLMDQDSVYSDTELQKMLDFLTSNYENIKQYPLIAPRSYSDVSVKVNRSEGLTPAKYVINSGSFLCISSVIGNGLRYDENIFLDGVDYEFCMQINNKKMKAMIFEDSILEQKLGYTRHGLCGIYCCHAPSRYYYIVQGRNYTNVKYYGKIRGNLINFIKLLGTVCKVLIYEDNKIIKIREILRACACGKYYNTEA